MTEDESSQTRSLGARVSKLERAAEGHERNASDLARAQSAFNDLLSRIDARIATLEADRQDRRIAEAGAAVENKQLRADVHDIKLFMKSMQDGNIIGKVVDMSGGFNRLFWLVIGAIVAGGIGAVFLAMRGAL